MLVRLVAHDLSKEEDIPSYTQICPDTIQGLDTHPRAHAHALPPHCSKLVIWTSRLV